MELFKDFKDLLRCKSLDFVKARRPATTSNPTKILKFNWRGNWVHYRSGTSDRGLIYEVLVRNPKKAEYYVSDDIQPKVIFDIGANIGVVSLWLAEKYPSAQIHAFEPMPENLTLLQKNTQHKLNIFVHKFGLSNENKRVPVYRNLDTNNLGGFSEFRRENDPQNAGNLDVIDFKMDVRSTAEIIDELQLESIDLIKIDTEGGEFEIIKSIPRPLLSKVKWLMGELHGRHIFETLSLIDPWMSVAVKKSIGSEVFTFFAKNRGLLIDEKYSIRRLHPE
jgi:FkbM family methyltransferase